ncbi:MAG: leucine-rich repeat protein [Paludibacteraceae bacterium]|nr:leucine-rich repeat protein [Paludibacteraceae bacterium]
MKKIFTYLIMSLWAITCIYATTPKYELVDDAIGDYYKVVADYTDQPYSGDIIITDSVMCLECSNPIYYPVKKIDNNCFDGSEITSISIPRTINQIGQYALHNCTTLTKVFYHGSFTEFSNINFGTDAIDFQNKAKAYLYVPQIYLNDFQNNYANSTLLMHFDGGILPIKAGEVNITAKVTTNENKDIDFNWFPVEGVEEYTLKIWKGSTLKWEYTIDQNGVIKTNKAYLPSATRETDLTIVVIVVSVGPLEDNVNYTYELQGTAGGSAIFNKAGSFSINTSNNSTNIQQEHKDVNTDITDIQIDNTTRSQKVILNGHLYINHSGHLYNALGGRIK